MIVNFIFLLILILGCVLILTSNQKETLYSRLPGFIETKIKNPLKSCVIFIKRKINYDLYNDELLTVLSYVKNITILGQSSSISTQLLLEELSDVSNLLRPAFLEMAHYITINDENSASKVLGNVIGNDIAKDVGKFLSSWERIKSVDVLETIETYKNILYQARNTRIIKRDEMISDIVYFPVVINCMLVLLNFIYVAYFLSIRF